jgi:hypothetical protein
LKPFSPLNPFPPLKRLKPFTPEPLRQPGQPTELLHKTKETLFAA